MPTECKPTSFVSEHTAEYALVPALCTLLRSRYKIVVPLFFWVTREGSRRSIEVGPSQLIRVVSVFARRPKLHGLRDPNLVVRLNELLFRRASISEPLGIPVYAGVPLAHSFAELGSQPRCAWFRIAGRCNLGSIGGTVEVELDSAGAPISPLVDSLTLLPSESLVSDIAASTRLMRWVDAIESLRVAQFDDGPDYRWSWIGGYKPFHLLLM